MAEKKFKARIVHKHDLESNWLKSALIPKQGEIVVYDVEIDAEGNTLTLPDGRTEAYTYERFKIGDGIKNVNDLPFANDTFKVTISSMGNSSDRTYSEIKAAYDAGKFVYAQAVNGDFYPFGRFGTNSAIFVRNTVTVGTPNFIVVWEVTITDEGCTRTLQMLNALKNPNAITFAGAVEATYDGSAAVEIALPTVDPELSDTSENAVQNKVVNAALGNISALVGDTSVSDQISTAIASSQADWNQNDETASDYIKNRLVYKKPAYPYPEDPVSVLNAETMYCIWDWTNETYKTTYQHAFTLSKVKDSYAHDDADYGSSRLELSLSNDGTTWNPWYFTWMDVYPAVCYSQMLDTKNYLMWEYGNIIYVILDLTTLTSEYASKFTNIGIFYYREANAAMPFTSVKVEFPNYSALSAKYIPKSIARTYQLDEVKEEVSELGLLIGDTSVSEQINTALQESVADWSQTDETAADYIKNKPEITTDEEILQLLSDSVNLSPLTENGNYLVEGDAYLIL